MSDEGLAEAWLEAADGRQWPLETNCPIGRSPSNHIIIDDRKVSRRHAVVHRQDVDEYWLVDLGSGNGSYVNGLRVSLPSRLNDGDVMSLGDFSLTFRQASPAGAEKSAVQASSMTVIDVQSIDCWMLLCDIVNSTQLSCEYENTVWASMVGSWAGDCRQIIELHGGVINKYLGDGFLAIWPGKEESVEHVKGALEALLSVQTESKLPFRLALHVGEVARGGGRALGEDNLSGFELILLFRMEKLAASLGRKFLCSEAVNELLGPRLALESAGEHEVAGFIDTRPREFFGIASAARKDKR